MSELLLLESPRLVNIILKDDCKPNQNFHLTVYVFGLHNTDDVWHDIIIIIIIIISHRNTVVLAIVGVSYHSRSIRFYT
jgi:hypothetical protein